MALYRIIILCIVMLLAGCLDGPEIKELREANTQLKNQVAELVSRNQKLVSSNQEAQAKINIDYGKRAAELEQMQMAAAISGGCRLLFNICPDSITAPGDAALQQGVSGGSRWIFWGIYLTKTLTILLPFLLLLELWTQRFKPNLNALNQARMDLQNAENQFTEIQQLQSSTQKNLKDLKEEYTLQRKNLHADLAKRKQEIEKIDAELESKNGQMQALEEERKKKESAVKALQSFKF